MNVFIFDKNKKVFVAAEILVAEYKDLPLKKNGWQFNWKKAHSTPDSEIFILKIRNSIDTVEGLIQLSIYEGMLFMDLIEVAPHNLGIKKRYDFVAGCLISYACNKSFRLETNYRGFLIFETKTKLRPWYEQKYYAQNAMHNRMFIEPMNSIRLIKEYLERKI